ncbi:Subtilisin-like proteinase Spm1 [Venturia nashicola]|uniref:Subtilisin-like proteinase Spm1 n=1 Tax=Venturia nashicola TaxID=86259 RepID=A0A4Z1NGI4_9PEZI|nr:Subtilisin-like proteinase Spm1 [Venturia nashicola]TLD18878.1 Subtilisin-like proteinase Spm1 [Venturia nashicola]
MLPLIFLSCFVAAFVVARPPPPAVEEPQAIEIEDTYIVKFKDDISEEVIKNHTSWIQSTTQYNEDGTVSRGIRHIFSLAFDGYSAVLDQETVRQVRQSPEVFYVNTVGTSVPPKTVLTLADPAPEPQIRTTNRITNDNSNPDTVQTEPHKGWNANRLSHRDYKASNYAPGPYLHDGYQGQGVNVYVLDTGINLAQPGFRGSSVVHGKNFVRGAGPSDVNGHGTMCAGVIAGNYAGLAPKANTTNVKIANDLDRAACDDTVAGIEWVVNQPGNNNMKVISMSQTGFTGRPDVSTAVAAAVKKGVHVVVCAGNYDVDACNVEPGNAPGAIVVGSVDAYNKLPTKATQPEGTNVGKCVTLFAPGSKVPTLSAKNISPDYRYWAWGTSIAAPQVAALVANQLSRVGPQKPEEIRQWLVKTATKGQIVGDLRGSPNLIAFSGVGEILGGGEQNRKKSGQQDGKTKGGTTKGNVAGAVSSSS